MLKNIADIKYVIMAKADDKAGLPWWTIYILNREGGCMWSYQVQEQGLETHSALTNFLEVFGYKFSQTDLPSRFSEYNPQVKEYYCLEVDEPTTEVLLPLLSDSLKE